MKIRPEGVKPIRALRIGIGLQILCRREEPGKNPFFSRT